MSTGFIYDSLKDGPNHQWQSWSTSFYFPFSLFPYFPSISSRPLPVIVASPKSTSGLPFYQIPHLHSVVSDSSGRCLYQDPPVSVWECKAPFDQPLKRRHGRNRQACSIFKRDSGRQPSNGLRVNDGVLGKGALLLQNGKEFM
jgi:hypothetical protein